MKYNRIKVNQNKFWTLDIVYMIRYSLSFLKYYFTLIITKFDDYLDYLEITRFRVWHSVSASSLWGSNTLKRSTKFGSGKDFGFLPIFSKKRTFSTSFPYVRGFTWDKGENVDSIEAQLILGEHYFATEKYYKFNDFQTYVVDSSSKRRHFLRTEGTYESFAPGFISKTKIVTGSNNELFIKGFFLVIFFLFFSIFFGFEFVYFIFHFSFLKFIGYSKFAYFGATNYIRFSFVNIFKKFILFASCLFFIIKPFLYFWYVIRILSSCFAQTLKDIVFLIYILIGPYLFKSYKWFVILSYKYFIKPRESIIILSFKHLVIQFFVSLGKIYFAFWRRIQICFRYSLILKFIMKFFARIWTTWIIYQILLLLWGQAPIWGIIYLVAKFPGFDHYFIFIPIITSSVILILWVISPSLRSFIQMHKCTRTGDYFSGYQERKYIKLMNTAFYKEISHEPLPFRMNRWKLRREVHDLRRLMEHELNKDARDIFQKDLRGSNLSPIYRKFNSNPDRLAYLSSFAEDIRGTEFLIDAESSFAEKSEAVSDLEEIFRSSTRFKYDSLEFKLYQRELAQFYYANSLTGLNKGLLNRIIYYYKDYERLNTSFFYMDIEQPYSQIPGFIFKGLSPKLYSLRIFNFFTLALDFNYYINKPSEFLKNKERPQFNYLDEYPEKYIPRIYNDESRVNWDFNFELSDYEHAWDSVSEIYVSDSEFRGGIKSINWFTSPSPIDDSSLLNMLNKHVGNSNFKYRNLSTYIQSFKDLDWSIRLNSNIFLSYSFITDFHSFGFPAWIFKNFFFSLLDYNNNQDNFGSWVNHFISSGSYSYNSYEFSNGFFSYIDTSSFKINDYYYSTLGTFNSGLGKFYTHRVPAHPRYYPKGLRFWNSEIKNSTIIIKDLMTTGIADYLYLNSYALDRRGYSLLRRLEMSYEYQSSHLSELLTLASSVLDRYVLREQEKDKNTLMYDFLAILREVFRYDHPDDLRYRDFKGVEIKHKTKKVEFSDLPKSEQRRWASVKLGHLTFPHIKPNIVIKLLGMLFFSSVLWLQPYDNNTNEESEKMFRYFLKNFILYFIFGGLFL